MRSNPFRRNVPPFVRHAADASRSPRRRPPVPPAESYSPQPHPPLQPPPFGRPPSDRRALAGAVLAVVAVAGALGWAMLRGDAGERASTRIALPQSRPGSAAADGALSPQVAMTAQQMQDAAAREALALMSGTPGDLVPQADLTAPPLQGVLPVPGDAVLAALPVPVTDERAVLSKAGKSPVLIFDARDRDDAPASGGAKAGDDVVLRVAPSPIPVTATRIDPRGRVSRGTLIPAVLETAIDGSAPGGVRAVITSDVRSADGSRVLIPRSSRLVGSYRSNGSGAGARTLVVWTQLRRPDGGSVAIGSSGGKNDKAFLDSFGQAAVQSIVSGPGARVRTGEPIRVYAASDVDVGKGK